MRCAISIHALCEEGDDSVQLGVHQIGLFLSTPSARRATAASAAPFGGLMISIHALCEEGDFRMLLNSALISLFLSTPSARRATHILSKGDFRPRNFYPRPLRGGRRRLVDSLLLGGAISIHALCEEGDCRSQQVRCRFPAISIHALCEEGDLAVCFIMAI